jgi:hypothetical protein
VVAPYTQTRCSKTLVHQTARDIKNISAVLQVGCSEANNSNSIVHRSATTFFSCFRKILSSMFQVHIFLFETFNQMFYSTYLQEKQQTYKQKILSKNSI